ncbi:hypothetical protein [Christiangramia sabulilitoris]|uniref:LVIVD repeat-containing protein n=1 Tax=Christiangramia sabulilitoris TaxID=2583991 RepID=A0A550I9J6_9FLAO|nr:hypothetical protein [Christiangramia sabulilitoris]TRO67488.1 hypothetical protein FGM01_06275 [Christiangramia sabulilitoris]
MFKRLLGLGLFTALIFTSCENDDSIPESLDKDYNTSNDESELDSAINFDETGVIGIANINSHRGEESASAFGIEQIAFIEPPVVNGESLRATHVDVKGDFAYVSYNKEGAIYLGGIDIIDVSDKYHPVLVSRMKTDIADINSLYMDNKGYLVFTGASAREANDGAGNRSIQGFVAVQNGRFSGDFQIDYSNPGNAGVHILVVNGEAIIISGDAGGVGNFTYPGYLTPFDNKSFLDYGDLRSAAYKNNILAVLSGEAGLLSLGINGGLVENSRIPTAALTPESKRTIAWFGDNVLVSEGTEGVGIYNFEAGTKIASLPLKVHPDATAISTSDQVTNAVSTDNNFIYMANGGAGLDIIKLNERLNPLAEGIAEIQGSANFVQAKGEYIYVASGRGLKILKIVAPQADEIQSAGFLNCSEYNAYAGDKNLNIASGKEFSYSGLMNLKHLNVNGILNFCGDMLIESSANLSSDAILNMSGNFKLGNKKSTENLIINSNSKFKIEGVMEIHGDLHINSGGTLEFVGNDSKIYVSGEVRVHSGGEVLGEFEDLNNKF